MPRATLNASSTTSRSIPVHFIASPLAVNEAALRQMLGLVGKSARAAANASWRFRKKHGIRTLPGGVYPVRAIERAMDEEAR